MDSENGDIDDLLALMEDDDDEDFENEKPNVEGEDTEASVLEEEYLELERKMKEIKDKMRKKKISSPKPTNPELTQNSRSSPSEPKDTSKKSEISSKEDNKPSKSAFLEAFGDPLLGSPSHVNNTQISGSAKGSHPEPALKRSSPVTKHNSPSSQSDLSQMGSKRAASQSSVDTEYPSQKKRRIANTQPCTSASRPVANSQPFASTFHPFTESLRNNVIHAKNAKKEQKNETVITEIEHFSRLRMKKCFVPNSEMKLRMEGKRFMKLGLIRSTTKISAETDWVTIGVVAKQLDRQTTKNGKPFSILNLTDLDDCTKTVSFFLFGMVHEKITKLVAVGSVIGLLNPSVMPPKESQNSFGDTPALTVDVAERVMHIGLSADLGWCTATKWRNKQPAGKCLAIVNKQYSQVCVFHMQSKYKKASAKRSELQGGTASAPLPQKYKNTLWNNVKNDQFFYGGKLYSASPASNSKATQNPTEPKVKLTKFLANHSDLTKTGNKELMEKSNVMNALSGIKGHHLVSGCSDAFATMLASGDNVAGSRQFLNHLKNLNKDEEIKTTNAKPQTPAEFLKERANTIKSQEKKTPPKENVLPSKAGSLLSQIKQNAAFKSQESKTTGRPKENVPPPKVGSLLSQIKQNAANSKRLSSSPSSSSLLDHTKRNASAPKQKISEDKYISPDDIKKATANMVRARKMELLKSVPLPKLGRDVPQLGKGFSGDIDLFDNENPLFQKSTTNTKAEMAKKKAIAKLRKDDGTVSIPKKDPNRGVLQQIENIRKSDTAKSRILKKVDRNCRPLGENLKKKVEQKKSKFGTMSEEEFKKILDCKSSFSKELESSDLEQHDKYFDPLIRKEMMEQKMSETFEVPCKIVSCIECKYTFWSPHERCTQMKHHLNWSNAKKRFFQCSQCKQRTITWRNYPSKSCNKCGSIKNWREASMLKEKDVKVLDAETLLIRGLEHGKFLNSLQ